ncbi:survival motor neuron protein-like isoform X2 [Solea solea]|uniref:survival motor neuron protein-like isoform X2 n=1 Tax=Solea solea TaxID=90069 RepID=UPI00272A562B|nr:survival motor neuron protein-like isoform X2 [Solea solea]
MTEPEENHETVQFLCATTKHETSLLESLEKTLQISHDNKSTGSPASEETESREEAEHKEAAQQDVLSVCSPAAETKWEAGSQCIAVYSKDGQVYPATVVCLDGNRCRVRFTGYDNEEDVELSTLQSPPVAPPTQTSQEWRPGSRCRAVFSEDSLVYPAVVLWVKGQQCRVRFDDYNNEEELDVCSLLSPDELHGPNRTSSKGIMWKRRGRREENLGERGGGGGEERRSTRTDDQLRFSSNKDTTTNQITAEKPTNPSVPLFPPFPPPDQLTSADSLSFVPPPPPLWTFGGKESTDSASSMLMLWYTCGFHTGSYMTQQKFRSTSKD